MLYADFGVSRDYSDAVDSATDGRPDAFTARYCAPEVQDHGRRTSKSDVFSLGVVFLLLYTALVGANGIVDLARKGRFYEYIENILGEVEGWTAHPEVVECLGGMIREEEGERITAGEVVGVLGGGGAKYFCSDCVGEDGRLYLSLPWIGWRLIFGVVSTEIDVVTRRRDFTGPVSSSSSGVTLHSNTDQVQTLSPSEGKASLSESGGCSLRALPSTGTLSEDTGGTDSAMTSLQKQVPSTTPQSPSEPIQDSIVYVPSKETIYPHQTSPQSMVGHFPFEAHPTRMATVPL